jgi:hypothetical protein
MASNVLKPGHRLALDLNRFLEHLLRTHPKAVVAVFLPVDDEFFLGFAVQSHAEDGLLVVGNLPGLSSGPRRRQLSVPLGVVCEVQLSYDKGVRPATGKCLCGASLR